MISSPDFLSVPTKSKCSISRPDSPCLGATKPYHHLKKLRNGETDRFCCSLTSIHRHSATTTRRTAAAGPCSGHPRLSPHKVSTQMSFPTPPFPNSPEPHPFQMPTILGARTAVLAPLVDWWVWWHVFLFSTVWFFIIYLIWCMKQLIGNSHLLIRQEDEPLHKPDCRVENADSVSLFGIAKHNQFYHDLPLPYLIHQVLLKKFI